jgi:CheY-like chemotaxis protein
MSRILLIDDDPQINEVVKATLELLGHTVAAVEDPGQSRKVFAEFHPNITLIDYALPGQSGLVLLHALGENHPDAIRFLATGMSDFGLLKQAMAAGASSMLCKPYRVADLVGLIETATLLEAALQAEASSIAPQCDELHLSCPAAGGVQSADLAQIVHFARSAGCDDDVAFRRLPVVACELMRNAATHGSSGTNDSFAVELKNRKPDLDLHVQSSGPAFAWEKAIARARAGMGKSRAAGLQLVVALSDHINYDDDGRLACARIRMLSEGAQS